ncbi:MAG: hypothetical protein LC740_01880 [Actinobacteria bacterium]|nr:hypothetical protein [Actinomycetota bacterium]
MVVVAEILTFPLIFGAWITALVFTVLNAAVLYVRITEENRALAEIAVSSQPSVVGENQEFRG